MGNFRNNTVQRRLIEETAERVLEEFAVKTGQAVYAPIPISDLATFYGLEQRTIPSQVVSGALIEEEGALYTNSVEAANPVWGMQRKRFTTAHEIAHRILAKMDGKSPHTIILWGIRGKETPDQLHNILERLADQIAASLLMPRAIVIAECEKIKKIDAETISQLAEIFHVSRQAIALRVLELKEYGENLHSIINLDSLNQLIIKIGQNRPDWAIARQAVDIHTQTKEDELQLLEEEISADINQRVMDLIVGLGLVRVARGKSSRAGSSPSAHLKRPLIIEFAGPPNSGKDTQLNILLHSLRDRMHYRVHVIEDTYRYNELETPDNTSLNRFRQSTFRLLDKFISLFDKLSKYDVVLINKGTFDNLAFQRFYTLTGKQTKEEEQVYHNLLFQKPWGGTTDLVILLTVAPEVSIVREEQEVAAAGSRLANEITEAPLRKVTKTTMKIENLRILNECYESVLKEFGSRFRSIRALHTLANEEKDTIALELAPDLSKCLAQSPQLEVDSITNLSGKNRTDKSKQDLQLHLL